MDLEDGGQLPSSRLQIKPGRTHLQIAEGLPNYLAGKVDLSPCAPPYWARLMAISIPSKHCFPNVGQPGPARTPALSITSGCPSPRGAHTPPLGVHRSPAGLPCREVLMLIRAPGSCHTMASGG